MAQLCIRWLFSLWQSPENEDFPQQGANDLLNLCKGTIGRLVKRPSEQYAMNKHKCVLLVRRLSDTQDILADIQQSSSLDAKTVPVLQELHQALKGVERVIQSSCITGTSEWLRAAVEQGDMKETFSSLLYDVKWHTDVLQSILMDELFGGSRTNFEPAWCNGKLSVGDERGLLNAKKQDEKALKDRLRSVKVDDPIEKDLVYKLLTKMKLVEDHELPSEISIEGAYRLVENSDQAVKEQSAEVGKDSNGGGLVTSSFNLLFLNPPKPNKTPSQRQISW